MVLIVSLYPFLAKSTGLTRVYNDKAETSKDTIVQMKFMQQCVNDTLEQHSDAINEYDDEDVNEYERYTMIVSFHTAIASNEFPFTIPHAKPVRYSCTTTFRQMTKKEIVTAMQREVADTIEMLEEESPMISLVIE